MVAYRCETCGTTETGTPDRLDRHWIAVVPAGADTVGRHAALRYCGAGCLEETRAERAKGQVVISLGETIRPLSDWFDSHAGSRRFIALLSPT